jgi:hypothetical protein
MARKVTKIGELELGGDARQLPGGLIIAPPHLRSDVRKAPPKDSPDFEIYDVADRAVGTTLLRKLRLSDSDRAKIQILTGVIAIPVREGRLKRPGDRAKEYFSDSHREADADDFVVVCWGFIDFFSAVESINADKVLSTAAGFLRRAWERMDEDDRKKMIAGLMAYIGELQTAGVLEATPSDRLARVAMLIGEAASLVSVVSSEPTTTTLFEHRQIDPITGKKPTAIDWFNTHWLPRVQAGEITGEDIRAADPRYYQSLASGLRARKQKLSDILPPPRTRISGNPQEQVAHHREVAAKRVKRWRANQKASPK